MAAMLIHAAGESSSGDLPPQTRAVALEVAQIDHQRIEENGELFAISIAPIDDAYLKTVRKATGSLRLIR